MITVSVSMPKILINLIKDHPKALGFILVITLLVMAARWFLEVGAMEVELQKKTDKIESLNLQLAKSNASVKKLESDYRTAFNNQNKDLEICHSDRKAVKNHLDSLKIQTEKRKLETDDYEKKVFGYKGDSSCSAQLIPASLQPFR